MAAATFGVYVHIPFCASKCDYCAFATWTDRDHLVDAYLAALRTEIARAVDAGLPVADTVFVGGGTPTLVPADGLASVIASIPVECGCRDHRRVQPRRRHRRAADDLPGAGVNRVSLGVQSMSAHVLASLGRTHDQANVERAVAAIELGRHAVVQPRPDLRGGRGVDRRLALARSRRRWRSTRRTSLPTA